MFDKRASITYSKYYQLGCKVAKDTLNKEDYSGIKNTLKTLDDTGKTYRQHKSNLNKEVEKYTKKLPAVVQKALPKNLVDTAIRNIEPLYIADKITSPEGREDLQREYSFVPGKKDTMMDLAIDVKNSLLSSPFSVKGTASRARTLSRSIKGAKKMEERRVQTAKELDKASRRGDKSKAQQKKDLLRLQTEMQPRFSSYL